MINHQKEIKNGINIHKIKIKQITKEENMKKKVMLKSKYFKTNIQISKN
jgi:hypothetical protein